ncbi:hypothetical protein HK100_005638 [Physocladia obscura]|uniref:Carboxypeptidase n=1 Tax=Physocladia obscura TaxID=109957 RepID=A0AAD5STF9_9FUNG|nr:hypothetical protein HK100_005638 [Physocladia obscura]
MAKRSDFAVTSLPLVTSAINTTLNGQYAGLLPIVSCLARFKIITALLQNDIGIMTQNAEGKIDNYFFWYFPAAPGVISSNLVVWFNGGPGCSSLEGLFTEHGPIMFNSSGSLYANPYGWHNQANVLYVEQPVGTGFSVDNTKKSYDEIALAGYFASFLNNFYNVFNETKSYDLYLTGESYAGTYIPYIATTLAKTKTSDGTDIKITGIGMGNPAMGQTLNSPTMDYNFFLATNNFWNSSSLKSQATACLTTNCSVGSLASAWYTLNDNTFGVGNTCFDPYNVYFTMPCDNAFSDHGYLAEQAMSNFLNVRKTASVRNAIHLTSLASTFTWSECSSIHLTSTNAASQTLLANLISLGIKVLIYDGNYDSVCDYISVETALAKLVWGGGTGFSNESNPWNIGTHQGGLIWDERGLKYIRVFGVGHMVGADDPTKAARLLNELLTSSTDT